MWKKELLGNRIKISADRWPWMNRYHGMLSTEAERKAGGNYGWGQPDGMGRFGGGWNWNLGFQTGGWSKAYGISIIFNLLYGSVSIQYRSKAHRAKLAAETEAARAEEIRKAREASDKRLKAIEERQRARAPVVSPAVDDGRSTSIPFPGDDIPF